MLPPSQPLALDVVLREGGGRGAAGRAAVFARIQRARLRLSGVKCKPPGGRGGDGGGHVSGAVPARPFASIRD